LPKQVIRGLATANLQGRAQIVRLQEDDISPSNLVFYLDGAHSPESMEICANWFSHTIKEEKQKEPFKDYKQVINIYSISEIVQSAHVN
jgi:folylpolyglutamate synthase